MAHLVMGSGNKPRIGLERESSLAMRPAQAAADESGAGRKGERTPVPKDLGNKLWRGIPGVAGA